ncbi:DUF3822 family protein [Aestuariivivens insulae]|uniref:DUF3822 family protein n=1 Tax=Aestuariivivens insulae TaxID=1621988 RepID=UPI001F567476|nr:DUF3822 family protein [Aestuariivivens insulae]
MTLKKTKTQQDITNYRLSIQISLSGLSFCILDKNTNNVTVLKDFKFEKKLNPLEVLDYLKHLFTTEATLNQTFSSVNVIHTNELSTLVAKDLFNEDCLADYLKFNAKILKSDFIAYDTINGHNMVNVYVPYVNINNFIYDTFGAFTYKHFSTVLIENILSIEKNATELKVYVHVGINHFEIVATDQGKLLLYNTFDYKTKEDFIYYILFTFEQLKLDPETHRLVLLGNISKDSELYDIAYKYIRHVGFGNRNSNHKLNEESANKHANFIILNNF